MRSIPTGLVLRPGRTEIRAWDWRGTAVFRDVFVVCNPPRRGPSPTTDGRSPTPIERIPPPRAAIRYDVRTAPPSGVT